MSNLRLPFLLVMSLTMLSSGLAQQLANQSNGTLPHLAPQRIRFEHLTVADGLPENSVECMLQDHLGFIWLGTQGGLARFDGTTLVSYQYDPKKPNTLKGGLIKALYEDHNGDIWIGCESLFRYERATGRFIEYPQNSPEKMGQRVGFINFIKEDKQGNLWTVTAKDQLQIWVLDRLNPRTKTWTYFRHNPKDSHSLANDGMYWNTINSIPDLSFAEDATGKIWVVTESPEGKTLHWFDQQMDRFTRFIPPAALINAFKEITSVSVIKQQLYLSSNYRGLFRLNLQTGQLTQLTHQPTLANSLRSDTVVQTHLDRYGLLWVSTKQGLDRLNLQTGAFTHVISKANDPTTPSGGILKFLQEMPNGDVWFASRNGLNFYDRQTGQYVRYELDPALGEGTLHGRAINSFLVDKTGLVWVGSWSGGLSKQSRLLTFPFLTSDPQNPNSLQSPSVSAVYEAPSEPGIIWFGTETGLDRFDKKTGIYTHYKHSSLISHSIGEGKVVAMAEDQRGRFWVATGRNGLFLLNRKTGQFTQFAHHPARPNSLMIDYLNKLLVASDGTLWISTVIGLDHFDPDRHTFTHYYKTESTYTPALFDQINRLTIPKRQVAAIVRPGPNVDRTVNFTLTQAEDLFVVAGVDMFTFEKLSYGWIEDATGKIVWEYSSSNSVIDGAYPNVRLQANVIRLQAGQYRLRYHSGKDYAYGKWTHAPPTHPELWGVQLIRLNSSDVLTLTRLLKNRLSNGMANASLFPLREDVSGRIWIGSNSGGVVVFYPATGTFKSHYDLFEGPISTPTLLADKQTGGFWVGDLTRGLLLLDQQGKTTKRYSLTDGLPSNTVRSLQPDKEYLWIATDNGLCWLNPHTGQIRSFGLRNGLQSLAFTTDASCKTSDGQLFFAGPKGVNAFYPGQLLFDSAVPPVVLTDLFINGQPATLGPDGQLPSHISITKEITLSHGQNDLTLQFAALSYNRGSESQYAFKLSPIDTAWVPIGATRQARFLDLQPGTYTFQVKAANADGVWNERGVSLKITVRPPWWQTWWAYLLYTLIAAVILRTYIVYRSKALRRENQLLEEKVVQRTNEVQQQKEELETQRDYLEETLNDLKATQVQLIQKEKLASLGELTAGIAHEIQNPLNFVNNFSEVSAELVEELKDELDRGDTQEAKAIANDLTQNLQKIHHHGGRASSIVKGMLEHSRTESGERRPTDLNALADEYLKIAYHGLRAKNKNFSCELLTDFDAMLAPVEVAPQEIGRVLLNLYNNAFYAVSERAKQSKDADYKPKVEVSTKHELNQVVILVRDNGTGIPESVRAKIFQPFFTTKPTGEGTGLGLSLSYDIITKGYGGTLRVESQVGEGTKFIIELPLL